MGSEGTTCRTSCGDSAGRAHDAAGRRRCKASTYATTTTHDTPELQWQIASYADVELLMGEAPTLIGCVHQDP